jgi:hypothetical protein
MKNTSNVYLSCPLSIPKKNLLEMVEFLTGPDFSLTYWNREYYVEEYYNLCDVMIVALPNNTFRYSIEDLPIGVKKEVKEAIKDKKPILLIYKSSNGYRLYKVDIIKNYILGIASTHKEAFDILLKDYSQPKSSECFSQSKSSKKLRNLLLYV